MTKQINIFYNFAIYMCLLLFATREALCVVTKWEIGQECVYALQKEADYLYLQEVIKVEDDKGIKDLIFLNGPLAGGGNTSLFALLRKPESCTIVLSATGRGIGVEPKKKKGYPNISIDYSYDRDESTGVISTKELTYYWNGKEYKKSQDKEDRNLNETALELFNKGRIEAAIKIWEKLAADIDIADAAVMNNLGFAYYKLGKQRKDTAFYSYPELERNREPTYFEQAEYYLTAALEKEPERWSALLNMGDLNYERNDFLWSIKNYDKLLRSEERRVGKECRRLCRSRWSPYH
jgi:tetratricopeptide (TPR) repeat protein